MTEPTPIPEVRQNPAENRFELEMDGFLAVLEYELEPGKLVAMHTGVPPELEGRGIASRLVRAALEHARANGLKVVPLCSFTSGYIGKHPEYADLLA